MANKEQIRQSFRKYVPDEFCDYVVRLLFSEKVHFKVSKPRKTKLGDYRHPRSEKGVHRISVNSDLNKYAFLITTLHEFAHMRTFIKYGNQVRPHGTEWKKEFSDLLRPLLSSAAVPESLKKVLNRGVNNIKASSCSDLHLLRELKKYDQKKEEVTFLEQLNNNEQFVLNGKVFERGVLRRTRFLCKEVASHRQYLIHRMAEVQQYNYERNDQ